MQALFSVFLDILYAINKKSIKKEDVSLRLSDYLANKGSDTSSTISISDMLEIVKENSDDIKLVTSVLSKDVCEKLGIERPKSVFKEDVIYSFGDEDEAYGGIAVDMNDGERYEVLKDKKYNLRKLRLITILILTLIFSRITSRVSLKSRLKKNCGRWELSAENTNCPISIWNLNLPVTD